MIYLNLTARLAKRLGVVPESGSESSLSSLGNWIARDIPTSSGDLVLVTNEKTLLSLVMVPGKTWDIRKDFLARLFNLLMMLEFPQKIVQNELVGASEIRFGKAKDRRVLGSMNDAAYYLIDLTDDSNAPKPLSTSSAERELADRIYGAIGHERPIKYARRLLKCARDV